MNQNLVLKLDLENAFVGFFHNSQPGIKILWFDFDINFQIELWFDL